MNGKILHVVASDEGTGSRIITAYFPDNIKFEDDLKTRRDDQHEVYELQGRRYEAGDNNIFRTIK